RFRADQRVCDGARAARVHAQRGSSGDQLTAPRPLDPTRSAGAGEPDLAVGRDLFTLPARALWALRPGLESATSVAHHRRTFDDVDVLDGDRAVLHELANVRQQTLDALRSIDPLHQHRQ